jgi:large subunit ribosomal protein L9
MEVILTQDIDKVGKAGEQVRVREGYSRNFLFPRKLAVPVTEGGLKFLEAKKKRADTKRQKEKETAAELAARAGKVKCLIKAKAGEGGKLFGSVTRQDISDTLEAQGVSVDRRHIDLFDPIHQVGEYQVRVRLHSEVEVMLKVIVVQA